MTPRKKTILLMLALPIWIGPWAIWGVTQVAYSELLEWVEAREKKKKFAEEFERQQGIRCSK